MEMETKNVQKLADLYTPPRGDSYVVEIKVKVAKQMNTSAKKIMLSYNDLPLKNNDLFDRRILNDVFVKLVSDEEANKYVILNVDSRDIYLPKFIQLKKTDTGFELTKILRHLSSPRVFDVFKVGGEHLDMAMTITDNGLEDNSHIVVENEYDEQQSSAINDSFNVRMMKLEIKEEVPSEVTQCPHDQELVVMDNEGRNVQFIAEREIISKYGINKGSVIQLVGSGMVSVTNVTAEQESINVQISPRMKGEDLMQKVSSKLNKSSDDLVLFISNAENTKFRWIESSEFLFKYGINQNSIIKWFEVQRLDHIETGELKHRSRYSTIYKARDTHNNQEFALKKYNIDFARTTPSEILFKSKAFGNELINSWKLRGSDHSDRIIEMLGIYKDGPQFYFAMELMEESLSDVIKRERFLTDRTVIKYTRQIIDGLTFLHDMKILHRNLKCSSVLLDKEGNVKLCSFGFSKYLIGQTDDDLINGFSGTRATDYHFASPETLENSEWSFYTDIWSLGATVIEMRTGKKPYHNLGPLDALDRIKRTKRLVYDRPVDMDDATHKIFDYFISCCTREIPHERSLPQNLLQEQYLNLHFV